MYKDVPAHKLNSKTPPEQVDDRLEWSREDAAAADYDADWEQLPEQDISRVYWEPVDEGAVRLISFSVVGSWILILCSPI